MGDYKIIQIIPAPEKMFAIYKDGPSPEMSPIVCLALIEYKDGYREVIAMDMTDGDGLIRQIQTVKYIDY